MYASRKNEVVNGTIENINIPTLLQGESNNLEGPISIQEALSALRQVKNDKSPGSDGYTVEFFEFFFTDLGIFMTQSINYGFYSSQMSVTKRQGVITCIPKEVKDKQFLKNWRPITLLYAVYKLASPCIAARLNTVLPKLIGEDQKGFLKGRYIGENIRLIYNTLLYVNKLQLPGLLLMVDFKKAFDSVAWSFIVKYLSRFNFGKNIKQWISTFYTNINSCMYVNGQYSEWFDVKRGMRHGDLLSPYLFLICAELLALMKCQNKNIHGITISDEEILLSQFADDITFFLDGKREPSSSCIHTLQKFVSMSGLNINLDKTTAVRIGSQRNLRLKLCQS